MLRIERVSVAYGKHVALHDVTPGRAGRPHHGHPRRRTAPARPRCSRPSPACMQAAARRAHPVRGSRHRARSAARDGRRRHRPGPGRPAAVRRHDSDRQPAHGRLHAARARRRGAPARPAARPVPAAGRAPPPARPHHERRRAADAGDRPRAHVGAQAAAARRALAGLGPLLVKDLFAILRAIGRGGQSVVLVEQNVRQSLRLADRVYVLENGRIERSGTVAELEKDAAIQRAYLGLSAERRPTQAPAPAARPSGGGFVNPFARSVTARNRFGHEEEQAMPHQLDGSAGSGFFHPFARTVDPRPAKPSRPVEAPRDPFSSPGRPGARRNAFRPQAASSTRRRVRPSNSTQGAYPLSPCPQGNGEGG